jgi:hypothetical protein
LEEVEASFQTLFEPAPPRRLANGAALPRLANERLALVGARLHQLTRIKLSPPQARPQRRLQTAEKKPEI